MQSRYDKGETEEERTAYLNCPMTKEQYYKFIDALLAAEKRNLRKAKLQIILMDAFLLKSWLRED